MKKLFSAIVVCAAFATSLVAQDVVKTQCGRPTGQQAFPLDEYVELSDHASCPEKDWAKVEGTIVSWGSIDCRYAKREVPSALVKGPLSIEGWRGEKIYAQAVVAAETELENLNYSFGEFIGPKGSRLPKEALSGGFVRYVMTDGLVPHKKRGLTGCGHRPDHTIYDSTMVADVIDHIAKSLPMEAKTTQGIWVNCQLPKDILPGIYKGVVTLKDGDKKLADLKLNIKVLSRILPDASEWKFHLDLWQNPYAVSRYYQVEPWTQDHFVAMEPIYRRLADAGQKVITASIMHKPWNGQTEDFFESMVTWTKMLDGTWRYDYDIFDAWVEFMMGIGIDQQINCYTMIPWKLTFRYFDQRTNQMVDLKAAPGDQEFTDLWLPFLKAFSAHLREKGWFEKTTIAIDERKLEQMLETIKLVKLADPEFKFSFAGHYHEETEADVYDYCIPIMRYYPDGVLERRKANGQFTTYYTCCTEPYPNGFTFSPAAENAWIGYYIAKENLDGYLKWAYNSWPLEPLLDSRFRTWSAGDTYMVYPGNRTSIRFERLLEGIQACEKINILREEFEARENFKGLQKIEDILSQFNIGEIPSRPAGGTVNAARTNINKL